MSSSGNSQVSVLTQRYDAVRSGVNANETILTPSSTTTNFGKLFSLPVDGYVYAQPLYVPNVLIPGQGTHNIVYIATEHDSVYAYDADGLVLQPLWKVNFTNPPDVTTVPVSANADPTATDIVPEVGITSTPVIDPSTGTLYVVAKTQEVSGSTTNYVYRLHALDMTTGNEGSGSPVVIQGQVPGTGSPNSNGFLVFSPLYSLQRPGLALVNNAVFVAFGSWGDSSVWHGWIFGYDKSSLSQVAAFSVSPNGSEGGIWMAGAGLAADANGYLYFSTANGAFDGISNFGDSYLKLATSGLTVVDYFTPYNQQTLDAGNLDVASGGVLLLPDSAGTVNHPHIMIGCGKNGAIYVLDRDNMGHFNSSGDTQIIQELLNVIGGTPANPQSTDEVENCFTTPAYWQGHVYFGAADDAIKMFNFTNGLLSTSAASQSATVYQPRGTVPVVSANGSTNGIVWAVENAGSVVGADLTGTSAVLHAYDATNLADELYNSSQVASDVAGKPVKFTVPTVVNGKVYVVTQTSIAVYGLLSSVPQAAAPTFSPAPGTYSSALSVTISDSTPGAVIYYTTDNSMPTSSSSMYTGPIAVNSSIVLNAITMAPGYRTSQVTDGLYAIGNNNTIVFAQGNYATPQSSQSTVTVPYAGMELAGDLNIVAVGWNDTTSSVSSVADSKGNTYTLAVGPTTGTGLQQSIYYAKNIVGGRNTVTVNFNQAATYVDVRVLEYMGLDPTSPLDVTAGAAGSGTSANSGSATTTSANELIFGAGMTNAAFTAAGSGFTARVITAPDSDIAEDKTVTITGSYSATATSSSGNWVMQTVAFKAALALTPDFTVSAAPASRTVIAGNAAAYTVSASAVNGSNSAVALTCSAASLPTGASCAFVPSSVTPGATAATAALSISTSVATPTGTSNVTVTGTSGSVSHDTSVSLTVNPVPPPPDFTIAATTLSPASVAAGGSATSAITIAPLNGFNGTVNLSCSSITPAVTPAPTCAFVPASIASGSGTSTLTLSTSATTPTGAYTVTVAGAGPANHTTTVTLTVTAALVQDFTLTAPALAPASVKAGASATSTITIAAVNGFNGSVALSCTIAPVVTQPATCLFNPTPVTGGAGASTLTVSTVAATSASLVPHSMGIFYAMWLPVGGLALLGAGFTSRKRKLWSFLLGCVLFSGLIFLAACGGSSSSGGGGHPDTSAGNYTITVTGTSGSLTHSASLSLTVQ